MLMQEVSGKKKGPGNCLVDVSDIFFFCSGRGNGGVRGTRRGEGSFLLKIPGGGGVQEGEGPRGREGVYGELGNFWGGGG